MTCAFVRMGSPRLSTKVSSLAVASLLFAFAVSSDADADEGGVSFWLPGQYGSFAALPPEPGFSMPLVTYAYSGDASRNRPLNIGGQIRLGVDARYLGQFFIPTYSPENDVLGERQECESCSAAINNPIW